MTGREPASLPEVGDILLTPEGRRGEVQRVEGAPPRAVLFMYADTPKGFRLERRKCRVLRTP